MRNDLSSRYNFDTRDNNFDIAKICTRLTICRTTYIDVLSSRFSEMCRLDKPFTSVHKKNILFHFAIIWCNIYLCNNYNFNLCKYGENKECDKRKMIKIDYINTKAFTQCHHDM